MPPDIGVGEFKSEQISITKKAYAIIEWWRCTGAKSPDTGVARYKAFPGWGRLLKRISLFNFSSTVEILFFSI